MGTASNSPTETRTPHRPGGGRALALWVAGVGMCTWVLWLVRDEAHEAQQALAYLLVVLGGSARHGRLVGLCLAVASFLSFNFFLLEPYYTLTIEDPLDWWVLVAFMVTGAVAAELFHRAQRAQTLAEDRAAELERLSALGAESLSVPRAVDAVAAIVRVIRTGLPAGVVRVVTFDAASGDARVLACAPPDAPEDLPAESACRLAREGRIVVIGPHGEERPSPPETELPSVLSQRPGARSLLVPLRIRDRTLGILQLTSPEGLLLDPSQAFFADTLSYYVALAVERVRLTAEAEHVEALREADRLKDALLASVSHDLRTPLTTIRALAAELRGTGDERSAIIEEEADRLNRLVTDLLDFSRIRTGALPLEPQLAAAEDLVGAVLQRLRGLPGSDRIEVRLPAGILVVGRFDFVHALRALSNLVENALRHTPPGDTVTLQVTEEAGKLVFGVMDRGPGIQPEDRERIFEPFVHGSSNEQAGTGLGLAIARRVAEAQGGSVVFRPRTGGGSVFELRLPSERLEELP